MDYYAILGVARSATQEQIRTAYRQRAFACHPDRVGADPRPFQELQEAYATLADPARRRAYDSTLARQEPRRAAAWAAGPTSAPRRRTPVEPLIPGEDAGAAGLDLSLAGSFAQHRPSLEELVEALLGGPAASRRRGRAHGDGVTVEVPLTRAQAALGGMVRLRVPLSVTCPLCRGSGAVWMFACWQCAGTGTTETEVPVDVRFPAGLQRDHCTQVPLPGSPPAGLWLNVVFRPTDLPL